tara:strand:- start:1536 stop:1865 length:330 start_codon:yes stop_codon:yes gene_type:complete
MLIKMKQKFISIPRELLEDLISGKLISIDICVYMYLCSKCSHGHRVFITRNEMLKSLTNMSLSRLSSSLSRLVEAGHLERKKLNGVTSTRLLTFVKDRHNIFIKGSVFK